MIDVSFEDANYMRTALALAKRGIGLVAPNPSVGCVIVDEHGHVVGRGWTQIGGRPHAETEAITRAGNKTRNATAYVTLEPCDHQGKTQACSKALIKAGVKRVVVACQDLDPRVSGRGIKRLKDSGIEVVEGVLEKEARDLNSGFFTRLTLGRPQITVKIASSLDGRIATRKGDSRWITGLEARANAHMLRARHDAVMIGIGTALVDNPQLTCRLGGMHIFSPSRIVADSSLQMPLSNSLVETAKSVPTIILTTKGVDNKKSKTLKKHGVKVIELEAKNSGQPTPKVMSDTLAKEGFNSVLIEGGSKLASSFIRAKLVDHLAWFHAPSVIGGDGIPSIAPFGVENLKEVIPFLRTSQIQCGKDLFETYKLDSNEK